MKTFAKLISGIFFVCITGILVSFNLPKNWIKGGTNHNNFECGFDGEIKHGGSASATIKCIVVDSAGFETIMQRCKPDSFLGKRIRMTGFVKSREVIGWAGLWFRIDQEGTTHRLGFDNMSGRPITGTTDWKQYEIVLDVPKGASRLAYGALLSGTGQIWFDDFKFEIVNDDVSTTGDEIKRNGKSRIDTTSTGIEAPTPTNLDFER